MSTRPPSIGYVYAPERRRYEVSDCVALPTGYDEVIGCRVPRDKLQCLCVVTSETPVTACFKVSEA